jgi:uncharacterized protein YyaL (SSP411 family)
VAPNRLAQEPSPYLRQHADNPVDWWPWSDEAFATARLRDVPVLISVGYSACHWCHVMAHESFEDTLVAEVLNAGFVAVKVDREERPDVDAVYMEAVQLAGAGGGWPMTVIALADGRPFWTGTYLPKGRFLGLLRRVSELWASQRAELETQAGRLADAVRQGAEIPGLSATNHGDDLDLAQLFGEPLTSGTALDGSEPGEGGGSRLLGAGAVARAADALLERYDPQWGGFGGAPKFPQPTTLEVLAQNSWRSGDAASLGALRRTLDAMSSGGIYDHLAGGFARYSTDRRWLVPHFEKMLYDNALLVLAYTHAWQLTGSPRYLQVVEETVGYLLSPPMRTPEGAWAAAEDADSEGEEGRFYVWDIAELRDVAGSAAAEWYGASAEGNWEGKNILWRPDIGGTTRPPEIELARLALLERRSGRPRPGLDDKVLTEWNAMAIAALAYAGSAFAQPTWVAAAVTTAEVLVAQLRRSDGRWLRSWHPGTAAGAGAGGRHLAYAGDYAWLVEAFTRLGEATGHAKWANAARETANFMLELFWDERSGGFFTSGSDAEPLIARMKDVYDGAVPSANATAVLALARLGELTGEPHFTDVARQTIGSLEPAMSRSPIAFPGMALAAGYLMSPKRQVVITTSGSQLVRPVWQRYLPDTVLAWAEPYPSPLWEGRDGPTTVGRAYLCQDYTCKLPVSEPAELAALLDKGPA